MNTPAQCSLSFVHARDVPRTVILRRGPSKWVRCILWHRDSDTFEDGQWFLGRINSEDCALNPEGTHIIYAAYSESRSTGKIGVRHTVLSQPPWFTALKVYRFSYSAGWGGQFLDNQRYFIHGATENRGLHRNATQLDQVFEAEKDDNNTLGFTHSNGQRVNLRPKDITWAKDGWAVPDPMEEYLVEGGRLSRNDGRLIRDFTDMTFEPIRAPYDDRADTDVPQDPWHPLDHE